MTAKPSRIKKPTVHTHWDSDEGMICPLCGEKLTHEFNDGGREVITPKGSLWVVTNYYKCLNSECNLNNSFPITHSSCLKRKKHSVEVWAKVIKYHFKFHLNYSQIVELVFSEWKISISAGTVRSICQYFEMAGKRHKDSEVRREIRENGEIYLSLDGAQPVEGEPALWVFTDRITDNVLCAKLLESAPAEVLRGIYEEIEDKFGVPIKAVVSDKQQNIVNSVKEFNPNIPHAFCQYHFLTHVSEPIKSKDSHLSTALKKHVRSLSLVQNEPMEEIEEPVEDDSPVAEVFMPIAEELKCAISARGNTFDTFAGKEMYENLEYITSRLEQCQTDGLSKRVLFSFRSLVNSLNDLLNTTQPLYNEICSLLHDFQWLRAILGHREWSGERIEKWVDRWVSVLHTRLEQKSMEHRPSDLKWQYASHKMKLQEAWQQWIRLEDSYSDGLYCSYDDPDLDFTNNAKERLFHHSKKHFKSLFGRQNIARAYQARGGLYAHFIDFDYSDEHISSVLLASEVPLVEANRREHNAVYTVERRKWRIREEDTGNLDKFERNLQILKSLE